MQGETNPKAIGKCQALSMQHLQRDTAKDSFQIARTIYVVAHMT